ncbi:MAG TPA: hypothetical protein V6C81_27870 [Planktothrix sp.]
MITVTTRMVSSLVLLCAYAIAASATAVDADTASGANSSSAQLQASVKASDVTAITSLKDIGELCRHIKQTTTDLLYETQRPVLAVVGNPTVVGTTIIPSRPDPSGIVNMGTMLPPRKKWVDHYKTDLSFLIPQLQAAVNDLNIPTENEAAQPFLSDIKKQLDSCIQWNNQLDKDSAVERLDNTSLAKDGAAINVAANKLDKDRKELEKSVKHDEKKH